MQKNKLLFAVMRLLCSVIDYLLLMFPVQLVMLGILGIPADNVDFLFRPLFAIYGVLMIEYNNGATVGKHFGKLMVVDSRGGKVSMLYAGIRELIRAMYLIPIFGWAAGAASALMLVFTGKTIHDFAANTKVIYEWQYDPPEDEP